MLRRVSIHLVVDCDPVPTHCRERAVILVDGVLDAVERDGLIQQLIIRGALHLDDQMVPSILQRIAGDASGHPLPRDVIPDVPFVAATDSALVSPGEAEVIEELVNVEF